MKSYLPKGLAGHLPKILEEIAVLGKKLVRVHTPADPPHEILKFHGSFIRKCM